MPHEADIARLTHMLEAAQEATAFALGRKREDLDTDRQLQYSLVRCVEIIGEAASKITPEFRMATPQIDWDDIIGMRHRLVHTYYDINLSIVWRTVEVELPPLIAELEKILKQ